MHFQSHTSQGAVPDEGSLVASSPTGHWSPGTDRERFRYQRVELSDRRLQQKRCAADLRSLTRPHAHAHGFVHQDS